MSGRQGAAKKTEKKHTTYNASEARKHFSDVFDKALFSGPVIVRKRNRTVAIVPAEWLERFEKLERERRRQKAGRRMEDVQENGGCDFDEFLEETGLKS